MSCNICAENFNKSNRINVVCQYCSFEACRSCCQRYLIDKQVSCCMNNSKNPDGTLQCGKEWSRKFMVDNFTKKFIANEWKQMQEKKCLDREKALLPATTANMAQKKQTNALQLERINIQKEIRFMQKRIRELKDRRQNLEVMWRNGGDMTRTSSTYNGRICGDPNCRGYLSTQWKCGVCDKYTCKECHTIKGDREDSNHVCSKELVETVKLLEKDTKACPKCKIPIFKIEGCDQMWCTECHTAFSWRTGNIETRIHNPHFYEWQRQQNNGNLPRAEGDYECGRTIEGITGSEVLTYIINNCFVYLLTNMERFKGDYFDFKAKNNILNVYENENKFDEFIDRLKRRNKKNVRIFNRMVHLKIEEINYYRVDEVNANEDLRIKFLNNEIDENKFKKLCQQRNKTNECKRDIFNIASLLVQMYTDIVYRFMGDWRDYRIKDNMKTWKEIEYIRDYVKNTKDDKGTALPVSSTVDISPNDFCSEYINIIVKCYSAHFEFLESYFLNIDNAVNYCNDLLTDNKKTFGGKGYRFDVKNYYVNGWPGREAFNVIKRNN